VIRTCDTAEYHGPDLITSSHTSRVFSRGREVQPAYPCLSQLHRVDGRWRVGDTQYAIVAAPGHDQALAPGNLTGKGPQP
jgi:hypothetical protein